MLEVNIKEARAGLSQLLNKVEQGQEILLTRRGKKVAYLVSTKNVHSLPSLKKFRKSIQLPGESLSKIVVRNREEERY